MNFDHLNTAKIFGDSSVKSRDISFEEYKALYVDEQADPRNADFYPTDYEVRKAYIVEVWFGAGRMKKRHQKISHIWGTMDELTGHGLELGFNWGGSIKWLLDRYPEVTLDGVDFAPYIFGNVPVFKEVFGERVVDFMEASCSKIPKPDGTYDFINSCSVFEHLPDCVYWDTLKECRRLLKEGGLLGVYLDEGRAEGKHLRMDPVGVTVADLEKNGFERVTNYLFRKVSKIRSREQLISTMPKGSVVAELGVWKGEFARFIWDETQPKEMHLIDCWAPQDELGKIEKLVASSSEQHEAWYQEARGRFEGVEGVIFHRGMTADMVERFPDGHFDWIYVDGDHTYEGCAADLRMYLPKVKEGGFIVCDDYCEEGLNYFGVKKAVDELCRDHGFKLEVYPKHVFEGEPRTEVEKLQEARITVQGGFRYTAEWYGTRIDEKWMSMGGDRSTPEGLKQWYDSGHNSGYRERLKRWFAPLDLKGRGLELGFQCGKTVNWLCGIYPDITFDILDWNEKLKVLEEPIRKVSRIRGFYIQDCRSIAQPDGYYDFITSLDFYEHLTEDVYFESIEECFRLLRPGGMFFVYLGHSNHPAHINVRPISVQVSDVKSKGFELIGQRVVAQDVMSIFRRP